MIRLGALRLHVSHRLFPRRSPRPLALDRGNVIYQAQSVAQVPQFVASLQPYSGSRKRSAYDLTAWIGLRSNLFSTEIWAANRRRSTAPPLTYEQYDVSER